MQSEILLVGGGKMGRAMALGMIRGGILLENRLCVADADPESRKWWGANMPEASVTDDAAKVAESAESIVLAVKPFQIESVIRHVQTLHPAVWRDRLVISIAAGVSLAQLTQWIGGNRIARVMPNTPALVGAGASAYCSAAGVTTADEEQLASILNSFGTSVAVPESLMDAVTGLSGSGPAYVFMFIEALADGGVLAGLPRGIAMKLAAQTVLGAAKMVAETGEHPGELKDAVASPGGTTIAAIRSLEHNAFRGAVMDAVVASANRSRQLGTDKH